MKVVLLIIAAGLAVLALFARGTSDFAAIGAFATLIGWWGKATIDGRSARHLVYAAAWALVVVSPFIIGFMRSQPIVGMAIFYTGWLIFPCLLHLLCAFAFWAERTPWLNRRARNTSPRTHA